MTVYILQRTTTEEFSFDPETIRLSWADRLDAWEGTFEDFLLDLFREIDGSLLGDGFFSDTTNTDIGLEIIERGNDE